MKTSRNFCLIVSIYLASICMPAIGQQPKDKLRLQLKHSISDYAVTGDVKLIENSIEKVSIETDGCGRVTVVLNCDSYPTIKAIPKLDDYLKSKTIKSCYDKQGNKQKNIILTISPETEDGLTTVTSRRILLLEKGGQEKKIWYEYTWYSRQLVNDRKSRNSGSCVLDADIEQKLMDVTDEEWAYSEIKEVSNFLGIGNGRYPAEDRISVPCEGLMNRFEMFNNPDSESMNIFGGKFAEKIFTFEEKVARDYGGLINGREFCE